jgi:hypothetical protein
VSFFLQKIGDTNMTTATQVLNDVIAVQLHFSIWTGRKKLGESDLSIQGETPPKEVINLGSKHTTDPKALNVFNTLKRQAERLCLSVGIPFLGGYAIPSAKADYIAKHLAIIVGKFEMEKVAYLARHEAIQAEWIGRFPAYERILRKALTPSKEVEQRISANYSMFQVQSAQGKVTSADTGLNNQVDSLSCTLDADVLKNAKKLLESLTDAIQPNQTNVNGLKSIREKVEGLAFLNGRFHNLVNEIKKVEAKMPITGKLTTDETNVLAGLLFRMSDESKLQSLMSNIGPAQETLRIENDAEEFELDAAPFDERDVTFDVGPPSSLSNESLNPALSSTFF